MRFRNGFSLTRREVIVESDDSTVSVGRPPSVTFEQYLRIVEVRVARQRIPSDKELAIELGLNPLTVGQAMRRGIRFYERRLRPKVK